MAWLRPDRRSDARLLGADAAAFAECYRRHEDAVLGFFLRRTRSAELAADLTAETFAGALASRDRFDPEAGEARGWLFGIARDVLGRSLERGRVEDGARRRPAVGPAVLPRRRRRDLPGGRTRAGRSVRGRRARRHLRGRRPLPPVAPDAAVSRVCGGTPLGGSAPPIPASGYSRAPGTAIGGCREDVDLDGPTVSPQTARRLRDVPICPPGSRRVVKYGLAGPAARTVTYGNAASAQTVTVAPGTDGAYLFVFDTTPTGTAGRQLTATLDDGSTCGPDDRDPGLVVCLVDHTRP